MTDFYAGSAAYAAEHGVPGGEKTHHLLRHSLAPEERGEGVLIFFNTDSLAEAVKQVKRMSQRDLQAKFREVRDSWSGHKADQPGLSVRALDMLQGVQQACASFREFALRLDAPLCGGCCVREV